MAGRTSLAKMTYAQLLDLRNQVERRMLQKQSEARAELREKMADLAKQQGMSLKDVLGSGRGRGKGKVPIKYRDPKNAANTWTGRGRMPRWMVAALKSNRGARKEDFLI